MHRLVSALALLALATTTPVAFASPAELHTVLEPTGHGQRQALLVLLPDTGEQGSSLLAAAEEAASRARGLRLWVGVAAVGTGPAAAADQVARVREDVRARGFDADDSDVVVAGWGPGGAAGAAQAGGSLAATAGLGDGSAAVSLRVLGELDRSVRVVSALAERPGRALVLPATDRAGLRSAEAGAVLSELALAAVGRTGQLEQRLAADRLVAAVDTAVADQRGPVCTDVQRHTADADPALLAVSDRASTALVAPTPDGLAARDLGGFLYDKAELHDEGATARLVTNSYVARGSGMVALEVMCKTKSRSAVALALTGDHEAVDPTEPTCGGFVESTLASARAAMSSAAQARTGGVTVLPDAMKAAGPEWVFSPLLQRPADPVTGRWEVQSPALLTELSDTQLDPEFAGNHYCKALSPLRALELLLDDALPPV